ncbi:MAG: biopolymer transporter ExbD [Methylacidiphilales bacterium]|nr:biopolymer transporter ExbD [Candidatus Methylacidiphilales bacterium]
MSKRTAGRLRRRSKSKKQPGLMLTSLMDVFTLLLFFLLVNTSGSNPLQSPAGLVAPLSISEQAPKEEAMVVVATPVEILIQNKKVISVAEVLSRSDVEINELVQALISVRSQDVGGLSVKPGEEDPRNELIILADKKHSYEFIRKIMISGRKAGFTRLTFAALGK